jgi:methionyl-tRNA synthetase
LEHIWEIVKGANKYIEETRPWELIKEDEKKFKETMKVLVRNLWQIIWLLNPFMPETAEKIKYQLETGKKEILFERIK